MQILLFLAVFAALFASYLNSYGRKECFPIWIVTNSIFLMNNYLIEEYAQVVLFICYIGMAIYGWIEWTKQERSSQKHA